MFGYVTINRQALAPEEFTRFRTCYCGLCSSIRTRHGRLSRLTLSNDLAFLGLLLSSLYEPEETERCERCAARPLRKHKCFRNDAVDYAADMNVALAYHKCLDDWRDDKNIFMLLQAKMLRRRYNTIAEAYPEKCAAIELRLSQILAYERQNAGADVPANAFGELLGELYAWHDDLWADTLREAGAALGRFIYLMDAYEDLPRDIRRHQYNPLKPLRERQDYEEFCRSMLTEMMGECASAVEKLPLIQDAKLIRNVLYSGVWSRYAMLQKKRNPTGKESSDQ